ncbi:MAG: hypothetical protein HY706_22065, partial [Candidatus Hydrogenedentes bacterium]|nr:hypothetical protein [Candidatus Hydrogenedentota bacterium]
MPTAKFKLANVVPPLVHLGTLKSLPIRVGPFIEHVRANVAGAPQGEIEGIAFESHGQLLVATKSEIQRRGSGDQWRSLQTFSPLASGEAVWNNPAVHMFRALNPDFDPENPKIEFDPGVSVGKINALARLQDTLWIGSETGLYQVPAKGGVAQHHGEYGVNGPLATRVRALAGDSKGRLWVGTPLGISVRAADGSWTHLRGKEGLPIEDVTALAIGSDNSIWIGTSSGAILYRPDAEGRKWFYRAGKRYLPNDNVRGIAVSPDDKSVLFATQDGVGKIEFRQTTLLEKAQTIEKLVNERHRRLGLVSECSLNNAANPTAHTIGDNDNDGLWTAYHIAAMSLCYGATHDEAAKKSAQEGMHALYTLQNASGTPGLVARSVVPFEEGKTKSEQWRPSADGRFYWKSDTSSDEIDGHYLAFYAYYEHIGQHDSQEKELCIKQVRDVTNYLVDHNYQLIDWNGKRTRWGFWNPEALNENPDDYDEIGLNALHILSFLQVAHYITGDDKFHKHYMK